MVTSAATITDPDRPGPPQRLRCEYLFNTRAAITLPSGQPHTVGAGSQAFREPWTETNP